MPKPRFDQWNVGISEDPVTRELVVELICGFRFSNKEAMVTGARERLQSYMSLLRMDWTDVIDRWVKESS